MATITVRIWGSAAKRFNLAKMTVRVSDDRSAIQAVAARIRRTTGLVFAGGPRLHITDQKDGTCIYQGTLGRPLLRSRGCSGEGEIWFSVPTH